MTLPSNIEAEQQLIGAILFDSKARLPLISDRMKAEYFYSAHHRKIYQAMVDLMENGKEANPVTIRIYISDETLYPYITACMKNPASGINVEDYANLLIELHALRMVHSYCDEAITFIRAGERSPIRLIDRIEEGLVTLRNIISTDNVEESIEWAVGELRKQLQAQEAGEAENSPKTGLVDLDRDLTGLTRKRLVVMAGRPGMGKTQVAINFARKVARQGFNVGMFMLEIDAIETTSRMISSESAMSHNPLPYSIIKRTDFNADQLNTFNTYSASTLRLPIKLDGRAGLSMAQIEAKARFWNNELEAKGEGLDLVVIDYLGLIKSAETYRGNRVQELGEIVLAAKNMAKSLNACVLLLCQLNRGVESRDDKRPHVSDLRDSGNIEEHADQILLLYRPNFYDQMDPRLNSDPEFIDIAERRKNDLLMRIGKNRLGPTRDITVYCDISTGDLASKSDRH